MTRTNRPPPTSYLEKTGAGAANPPEKITQSAQPLHRQPPHTAVVTLTQQQASKPAAITGRQPNTQLPQLDGRHRLQAPNI